MPSKSVSKLSPPSKFDQDIRGYEVWTHDDDMVLLDYVLHHLHGGGWNELEVRFNGRHSARLCNGRWQHLKTLLLKGLVEKQE
jgi:acetyl esterase/lipase